MNIDPWRVDSFGLKLCHRSRLFWLSWELLQVEGAVLEASAVEGLKGEVIFSAQVPVRFVKQFGLLRPVGFQPSQPHGPALPRADGQLGFTCAALMSVANREKDMFRYPPYQYRDRYGLTKQDGSGRMPSTAEKELLMGFSLGYSKACFSKHRQKGKDFEDERNKLLGNSWQVGVIALMISHLAFVLGIGPKLSAQDVVDRCYTLVKVSPLRQFCCAPPPPCL